MQEILAHRYPSEEIDGKFYEQPLKEHLFEVASLCHARADPIGLGDIAYLLGLAHDGGKVFRAFQSHLRGEKRHVNHSSAGAYYLYEKARSLKNQLLLLDSANEKVRKRHFKEFLGVISLPILMHHGLMDILPEEGIPVRQELGEENVYHYLYSAYRLQQAATPGSKVDLELERKQVEEFMASIEASLPKSMDALIVEAYKEWIVLAQKLESMALSKHQTKGKEAKVHLKEKLKFYQGATIRLLLSILKDGDIYDSANYFREEKEPRISESERDQLWARCQNRVETLAADFENRKNPSEVDLLRSSLSRQCKEAADLAEKGTFTLELPTGSGKTISVLRYAVNHARAKKKNKIFYSTAFLSVLEQNARQIENILEEPSYILEHHSNVIREEETGDESQRDLAQAGMRTYLTESWESPVILTTLVQLTNSLFKEKSAQIRRFSKLIDAVLIMDEVQSLPRKVIYPMNLITNFMQEVMHTTVIHCTATAPVYEYQGLRHPLQYSKIRGDSTSLATMPAESHVLDRVDFISLLGKTGRKKISTGDLAAHVRKEMEKADSALLICNKKSTVKALMEEFEGDDDIELVYLTTNLCARHRLDIIQRVKKQLEENREGDHHRILCIATQLVEAGVDLDFDLVYRGAAGLDSLIQSAGRCNREGKRMRDGKKVKGKCFAYRLFEEDLSRLPEIKEAQEAFLDIMLDAAEDGLFYPEELKREYYGRYYHNADFQMCYIFQEQGKKTGENSLIEALTTNGYVKTEIKKSLNDEEKFAFQSALSESGFHQNFRTAAKAFRLIDEQDTVGVIVLYDNDEIIRALQEASDHRDYYAAKKMLRNITPYTVQVSSSMIEEYSHAFYKLFDGEVFILQEDFYDCIEGLQLDAEKQEWIF